MALFAFELKYQVRSGPEGRAGLQSMRMAFERAGRELSDAARYIGPFAFPVFESFARRQFRGQGVGPNRGKWAPLKEAYLKRRFAQGYTGPVLVRTGRLRASLTTKEPTPDAIRRTSAHGFEWGTRVQYAHYHQLGTIHMADRPLFDFDERFEKGLRAAVLKGVRRALTASALDSVADTSGLDRRIRDEGGDEGGGE